MVLCSMRKSPSYSRPPTNFSKLLMILLVFSILSIAWIMAAALSLSPLLQILVGNMRKSPSYSRPPTNFSKLLMILNLCVVDNPTSEKENKAEPEPCHEILVNPARVVPGTDIAIIIKKWPKSDKNEHEIVKSAQKPDPKIFFCLKSYVPADSNSFVSADVPATGPLPSIERQRDLDDMIANFSTTEWMILMDRVKDFPKVAKEFLGTDVNDDNFYSTLQALVDKRKRAMSIQRYRAQQAKPMTRGDDLIAEYNKIKSAVERSTTSQGVKRSGPTLEPGSPKKMKSTASPSLGSTHADEVPADTGVSTAVSVPADQHVSADKSVPADTRILVGLCVSAEDATTTIPVNAPLDEDEPAEESSSLRRSTRKKSVAQKRTTHPSSIPFSTDDPDAAHMVDIIFASDDSDEDDSPHPIITGVHLLGWQTLIRLYGFVDALSQKQPLDGIALNLWGDLKIMLDTLEVDFSSHVWQDQHKEYPLEIGVMEQLLDHKLQIEKDPVVSITITGFGRPNGFSLSLPRLTYRSCLEASERL
nr:hypothetical protein [Tanacetum cinerariifolium]